MTVKTTGAEFKAFYNDVKFWPDGRWHEDEEVVINGVPRDEYSVSYDQLADTDKLAVTGGVVLEGDGKEVGSLEGLFKKWRREQSTTVVLVRVPNDKLDAFNAAIRAIGATKA